MNEVTSYHFSFSSEAFSVPSPKEVRLVQDEIGECVTTYYANGENQNHYAAKRRSGLFGWTSIVSKTFLAYGKTTLLSLLEPDYDSIIERTKIMKEIANQSFEDIMKTHAINRIIGYELLDQIVFDKQLPLEQGDYLYASFKKMAGEYARLQRWREEMVKPVEEDKISQVYTSSMESLNKAFEELKNPSSFNVAFENFKKAKNAESVLSRFEIDPKRTVAYTTTLLIAFIAFSLLRHSSSNVPSQIEC